MQYFVFLRFLIIFRSFGKEAKKVEELLQLIQPSDQMRLLSILSIRKGKRLIQRILPHLMNQEASIQILNCFINNLSLITKVIFVLSTVCEVIFSVIWRTMYYPSSTMFWPIFSMLWILSRLPTWLRGNDTTLFKTLPKADLAPVSSASCSTGDKFRSRNYPFR